MVIYDIWLLTIVSGSFDSVYGICFLIYLFGADNFKLSFTENGIIACSGKIREAIAFGFSISIVSDKKLNKIFYCLQYYL
jgi:hypothetical protein